MTLVRVSNRAHEPNCCCDGRPRPPVLSSHAGLHGSLHGGACSHRRGGRRLGSEFWSIGSIARGMNKLNCTTTRLSAAVCGAVQLVNAARYGTNTAGIFKRIPVRAAKLLSTKGRHDAVGRQPQVSGMGREGVPTGQGSRDSYRVPSGYGAGYVYSKCGQLLLGGRVLNCDVYTRAGDGYAGRLDRPADCAGWGSGVHPGEARRLVYQNPRSLTLGSVEPRRTRDAGHACRLLEYRGARPGYYSHVYAGYRTERALCQGD